MLGISFTIDPAAILVGLALMVQAYGLYSLPTRVGKSSTPTSGGLAAFALVLFALQGLAVNVLRLQYAAHHPGSATGWTVAIILWALYAFAALVTVANVGKSSRPMTGSTAGIAVVVTAFMLGLMFFLMLG